jgi:methylenetetrahydrofolate dehydrogenase (NADP+)/methenyltetrahydrofolate cyclohydrolase
MTAKIIDGKEFAARVRAKVAQHVSRLKQDHGIIPGLAVVLVGEDPASQVYVRSKGKMTVEVGMKSVEHRLDVETSEADLLALLDQLNNDPEIHGILVQLPLPKHLNEDLIINSISPAKDVDGFHISNVGLLGTGQKSMVPCTPLGCLMMLRDHHGSISGMDAVVIGRSNIVGKPMAQLLLNDSATVTIAHSRTKDLADVVRRADIVVAAVVRWCRAIGSRKARRSSMWASTVWTRPKRAKARRGWWAMCISPLAPNVQGPSRPCRVAWGR